MNSRLAHWNQAEEGAATAALLSSCASRRWAEGVTAGRPFASEDAFYAASDAVWAEMEEPDWMEAFRAHPRIGERKPAEASAQSKAWSREEQAQVDGAQEATLAALAEGNRVYEERFGFTYIACATGRSADEMLEMLRRRLGGERDAELREAAEQQRQIMQIRLRKWLES